VNLGWAIFRSLYRIDYLQISYPLQPGRFSRPDFCFFESCLKGNRRKAGKPTCNVISGVHPPALYSALQRRKKVGWCKQSWVLDTETVDITHFKSTLEGRHVH